MNKLSIEENGDDLVINFDDELIDELGWNVGDDIDWEIQSDGSITLIKHETTDD